MTKIADKLQLNFFRVEFSNSKLKFPCEVFDNWQQASTFLRKLPPHVHAHKEEDRDTGKVYVVAVRGNFESSEVRQFDLNEHRHLSKTIIESALADYFKSRNYRVRKDRFYLRVLESQPAIERQLAVVRRGMSLQAQQPFAESPDLYILNASWVTPAEFLESIENDTLREMSLDGGVIFRPERGADLPEELRKFRNKFIGIVKEIVSETEVAVYCRDHSLRLMPAHQLFLEAKPTTLAEYDKRLGQSRMSIWSEVLRLNHTLTSKGRRNTAVLRDRLSSIQRMLANGNSKNLLLTVPDIEGLGIEIDVSPMTIEFQSSV